MKLGIVAILMAAVLILSGCSGGNKLDTSAVEKSFASAEATLKAGADKAVAAIKNADYKGALEELQKLAKEVKLTDSQKQAVNDLIAQVQKAISDAAAKVAGEASKALGDVQKKVGQ